MTVFEKGNISIHTENIFPIIKKSLYTDHEIFLRELISNAVDALSKLKMASLAGEVSCNVPEPEITITVDKTDKSLSITDNGIGMDTEEIKKYINQVAFSSAEEFVKKYEKDANEIIGHFGLGFYSAFMVSKKVEIDTLSYKEDSKPIHWSCDGSPSFELSESNRTQIGTTIKLTLMDEEHEYLEPERIRQLVKTYSDFVPIPIRFEDTIINKQKALWKESAHNLTDNDYLEFYRYLYPYQEDPLLWIHLNTDYPYLLNGILYFPKLRPDVDVSKGHIKLFCNQVFVSDHCEEIIPDFLMPLRGVIDSPDIPLNVSRSALTNHRTVRSIANHIAKKIADRLKEIYENNTEEYVKCWQDVGTFVKYGSLKDEKFKKHVEDILIYKTTHTANESETPQVQVEEKGDAWKDVASDKNGPIELTVDEIVTAIQGVGRETRLPSEEVDVLIKALFSKTLKYKNYDFKTLKELKESGIDLKEWAVSFKDFDKFYKQSKSAFGTLTTAADINTAHKSVFFLLHLINKEIRFQMYVSFPGASLIGVSGAKITCAILTCPSPGVSPL